jgi:hypothetical protein
MKGLSVDCKGWPGAHGTGQGGAARAGAGATSSVKRFAPSLWGGLHAWEEVAKWGGAEVLRFWSLTRMGPRCWSRTTVSFSEIESRGEALTGTTLRGRPVAAFKRGVATHLAQGVRAGSGWGLGEGDRLSDISASEPVSSECVRSHLPRAETRRDGCLEGDGGLPFTLLLRQYWVDHIESSFSISHWAFALSCSRHSAHQASNSRSMYGVILR